MSFALRRLILKHGPPGVRAQLAVVASLAAKRLDSALLTPLRAVIGDSPLVLVPTGALHALPWAMLASCGKRPVSVAPSASVWSRAARADAKSAARPPGRRPAHLRARSAGRRGGIRDLAVVHPEAVRLVGEDARIDAVMDALGRADHAHVAAHGAFRADNPLFSSLELADGPLTVYDLERLGGAPRRLVLSACDSGLTQVSSGDELIGLSAALFALGTTAMIASVVPVRDDTTRALMVAVHRRMASGEPPATALAAARAELDVGVASGPSAAAFWSRFPKRRL